MFPKRGENNQKYLNITPEIHKTKSAEEKGFNSLLIFQGHF